VPIRPVAACEVAVGRRAEAEELALGQHFDPRRGEAATGCFVWLSIFCWLKIQISARTAGWSPQLV